MMNDYVIREIKQKEIVDGIKVLWQAFGRRTTSEGINQDDTLWNKLIKEKIAKFFVAIKDKRIIGIGGLFLFKKIAAVGYFGVLPEFQRKGVGNHIFKVILEIVNKLGYKTIELYASVIGEPLYKKFGFKGGYYATKYELPKSISKFNLHNNDIRVINILPKWLLNLDKRAFGCDRKGFLSSKIELGGKFIIVENKGYGLYSNNRIGPVIAYDVITAVKVIQKSILLGAKVIIIPKHKFLPNKLFDKIILNEVEDGTSRKMFYGKKIEKDLNLLYALSSFAKG